MPSAIQYAIKDGRLVTLADVQRGETGLACYTCGDRIVVKYGRGQFVDGQGRATRQRQALLMYHADFCNRPHPVNRQTEGRKTHPCQALGHSAAVAAFCRRGYFWCSTCAMSRSSS